MGVDVDMIVVPERTLENLPISMREYLIENLRKYTLLGQTVYALCGLELIQYIWDGFEFGSEEERKIVKQLVDQYEEYTTDYDDEIARAYMWIVTEDENNSLDMIYE